MRMNWGVLGVAKIATEKVIPAMLGSENFNVLGIASRDHARAKSAADRLGLLKAYDSYDALIADPDIDIVYIPLPNHLHFTYALKCIEAGKHVLCEKPITLKSDEIKKLIAARNRHGVKIGEAFMVKSHPQWIKARELVLSGYLGKVKLVQGYFNYYNVDPQNIRNIDMYGGGAMWDIGCYPVMTARFVLGEEPTKVVALMEKDGEFGTDALSSVIMRFPSAQVVFSVSTQLSNSQRMIFIGDKQNMEIKIPFNAPNDQATQLIINSGNILQDNNEEIYFDICDQYALQAEAFVRSIKNKTEAPVSLEEAWSNTRVLEAIFESAATGRWVEVQQ